MCGWSSTVEPAFALNWQPTGAPNNRWSSPACSSDGTKLVAVVGINFSPPPIPVSTGSPTVRLAPTGLVWPRRRISQAGGDRRLDLQSHPRRRRWRPRLHVGRFRGDMVADECAEQPVVFGCLIGGRLQAGGLRRLLLFQHGLGFDFRLDQFRRGLDHDQCAHKCLELCGVIGGWNPVGGGVWRHFPGKCQRNFYLDGFWSHVDIQQHLRRFSSRGFAGLDLRGVFGGWIHANGNARFEIL